uniref:(northern house mosquito) hypothetical protein n=1 Tax=Culex pipiens TaxID=7175 RepID=A0A8D8GYC2_CULPI
MCISFLLKPDQAKGKQTKTNKMLITSFKNYSRKKTTILNSDIVANTHTQTTQNLQKYSGKLQYSENYFSPDISRKKESSEKSGNGNRYRIRVLVRNARKSISFPFIITVYKARGKFCELTKKFDAALSLKAFSFSKSCILRRRRGFPRSRRKGAIGNCITFNNRKITHASKFKNDLEERRVRNTLLLHNRFSLVAQGNDGKRGITNPYK